MKEPASLVEKAKNYHLHRLGIATLFGGILVPIFLSLWPDDDLIALAAVAAAVLGILLLDLMLRERVQRLIARLGKKAHDKWGDEEPQVASDPVEAMPAPLTNAPEKRERPKSKKQKALLAANMPFSAVIERVIATKEPFPEETGKRRGWINAINLEIADEIVKHGLTVVGRSGGTSREPLTSGELESARVKITGRTISVFNGWQSVDYNDILFVESEIDEIWPPTPKKSDESEAK